MVSSVFFLRVIFLAAYTAVKELIPEPAWAHLFLAAYTAVKSRTTNIRAASIFLAAYTAVK